MRLTRRPRLSSRQPMEAAARPLPKLDTTPPVTKTYFADMGATSLLDAWDWTYLVGTIKYDRIRHTKETEKATVCALHPTRISITYLYSYIYRESPEPIPNTGRQNTAKIDAGISLRRPSWRAV